MFFLLFVFPYVAVLVLAQNNATSEIVPLLQQGHLVPNILPLFNATVGPLTVTYPQGIVNYGNNVSVQSVAFAPTLHFAAEAAFPSAQYTFAMIDPDAPSPINPSSAQIRHWLVADVSPSSSAVNLTNGNVLSAYRSPSPPAGSAAHRYTFVLLRQSPGRVVSILNQTSTSNFNLTQFIFGNDLTIVSANYFNATAVTISSTAAAAPSPSRATSSGAATVTSTGSSEGAVRAAYSTCLLVLATTLVLLLPSLNTT